MAGNSSKLGCRLSTVALAFAIRHPRGPRPLVFAGGVESGWPGMFESSVTDASSPREAPTIGLPALSNTISAPRSVLFVTFVDSQISRQAVVPSVGLIVVTVSRSAPLVMGEVLGVFPDSVGRHVDGGGEWFAPVGCGGGFSPVVGDFGGVAVMGFGDADVAIQAAVAVVAGPFDDDDVIVEAQASADF